MPQVVVKMRLPFRLQVAEGTTFQVQQTDGSAVYCTVTDYEVPKAEEDMHGTGIDDGLGTFLQSEVSVRFPNQSIANWGTEVQWQFLNSAVSTVNRLLEAYRYVSRHASAQPIEKPLMYTVTAVDATGNPLPGVELIEVTDLRAPIAPMAVLNQAGVVHVQEVLSDALPIMYERLLLLDAAYFAMLGDARHAVFNADTALQVFVERALASTQSPPSSYYSKWDPGLSSVRGISPHHLQFPLQGKNVSVMEIVEFIHIVRNTIAHEGKPVFKVKHLGTEWEKKSHYASNHRQRDGMVVGAPLARELVATATNIVYELPKYFGTQP